MNVIMIMSDSMRYDHVGCNGSEWIRTPNLDTFAARATVFENAYCGSFPTIPNRTDIYTGTWTFPRRGWGPLLPEDRTLPAFLGANGFRTAFVFDTPHINKANMIRDWQQFEWIRGQEADRISIAGDSDGSTMHPTRPMVLDPDKNHHKIRSQSYSNTLHRRFESDYSSLKTFSAAEKWLEYNYDKGDFFLSIDAFDPHEPWDPPFWYADMYDPDYNDDPVVTIPYYQYCDHWTPEQIRHTRALYAGEVTMVDRAFGAFLSKVESMGLLDETIIIFMSDHGHLLGEHGRFGKSNRDRKVLGANDNRYAEGEWPLYREVSQINMMIAIPGAEGQRRDEMAQPVDIFPTVCDFLGVEQPSQLEGASLMPVVGTGSPDGATASSGGAPNGPGRRFAITSGEKMDMAVVTDGSWSLHFNPTGERVELYNLTADPGEAQNVYPDDAEPARALHGEALDYLRVTLPQSSVVASCRDLQM